MYWHYERLVGIYKDLDSYFFSGMEVDVGSAKSEENLKGDEVVGIGLI